MIHIETFPADEWFHDRGFGFGLETTLELQLVERIESGGQRVELFTHRRMGSVLAYNGELRLVEVDAAYREMLSHVPLTGRPFDKARVLILGGGDGEVLQEVLTHDFVAEVVVAESDAMLVHMAKKLGYAGAFADPRVTWVERPSGDVLSSGQEFDVILCDGETVTAVPAALRGNGVLAEGDGMLLTLEGAKYLRGVPFQPVTEIYHALSPFTPGGYLAFSLHARDGGSLAIPARSHTRNHYDPAVHRAAFSLPTWMQRAH